MCACEKVYCARVCACMSDCNAAAPSFIPPFIPPSHATDMAVTVHMFANARVECVKS